MKQKFAILVLFLFLLIGVAGCAPTKVTPTEKVADTAIPAVVETAIPAVVETAMPEGILHTSYWKDVYPDIYESYSIINTHDDGTKHAHSTLNEVLAEMDAPATCLVCKSSDYTQLYKKIGDDIFDMKYSDLVKMVGEVDAWGCYMCHGNDMESPAKAYSPEMLQWLAPDLLAKINPTDTSCGQCHNALDHPFTHGNGELTTTEALTAEKPYGDEFKETTYLDTLWNVASKSQFVPFTVDEETGVLIWSIASHPDIELYLGSTHQDLGVTCADCHMPTLTNAEGETYTSHNVSSSPLKSPEALDYCISCHKDYGATTQKEMIDYTRAHQQEVADADAVLQGAMTKLLELIATATADPNFDQAKLDQARDFYNRAYFYDLMQKAAENPGVKAAHDKAEMLALIDKAKGLTLQGLLLFE